MHGAAAGGAGDASLRAGGGAAFPVGGGGPGVLGFRRTTVIMDPRSGSPFVMTESSFGPEQFREMAFMAPGGGMANANAAGLSQGEFSISSFFNLFSQEE